MDPSFSSNHEEIHCVQESLGSSSNSSPNMNVLSGHPPHPPRSRAEIRRARAERNRSSARRSRLTRKAATVLRNEMAVAVAKENTMWKCKVAKLQQRAAMLRAVASVIGVDVEESQEETEG